LKIESEVGKTSYDTAIKKKTWQGGHKVGEKNSLSFPGFSRAITILLQRLLQQKLWRFRGV